QFRPGTPPGRQLPRRRPWGKRLSARRMQDSQACCLAAQCGRRGSIQARCKSRISPGGATLPDTRAVLHAAGTVVMGGLLAWLVLRYVVKPHCGGEISLDLLVNAVIAGALLGGFYAAVTVGVS